MTENKVIGDEASTDRLVSIDEIIRAWDACYGEDLPELYSGFFNLIRESASVRCPECETEHEEERMRG